MMTLQVFRFSKISLIKTADFSRSEDTREQFSFHFFQNHDIQAKTNAELVRIFKWLDGANDIEISNAKSTFERISYYNEFDWSFEHLSLFKNGMWIIWGDIIENKNFSLPKSQFKLDRIKMATNFYEFAKQMQ